MNADVVVIGAGVMGASIALELARSGRDVVVADKGDAVGGASTSASSSVVRTNYSTLEGVTAAWEATHAWRAFAELVGPIDGPIARFVATGMLMFDAPDHDRATTLHHFDTVGVPYEVVPAADVAARFPAVDNGRFWPPRTAADPAFFDQARGELDVLWMPDGGFVDDPQLAATNLMDAARLHGAAVRLGVEIVAVETADDAVTRLRTSAGQTIEATTVVNAAGPWSAQVNRLVDADLGLAVGTRALRQEVHTLKAPADFTPESGGAVVGDMDLGTYFRPHFGGTIIVGGVEAECDPLDWLDDADACDPAPTSSLFESQTYRVARRIPAAEVPLRPKGLAAAYDVTPDWVPTYDRTDIDGYYVAIGTSGNQFKNAPIVGGIMRTIIEACESGRDHDREPAVYECRHTGRALDLSHYSRRRTPNATSGTVLG
jgi:glycine/D-amino acid oxidase-like deaminating enzyme